MSNGSIVYKKKYTRLLYVLPISLCVVKKASILASYYLLVPENESEGRKNTLNQAKCDQFASNKKNMRKESLPHTPKIRIHRRMRINVDFSLELVVEL